MIAFLSFPKPFIGHLKTIQHNAIQSWKELDSKVEVYLAGRGEGFDEAAHKFGLKQIPDIETNCYGTPLVVSGLKEFLQKTKLKLRCVINTDIVLSSDFREAASAIDLKSYLGIGQRWDLDFNHSIDFSNRYWEKIFLSYAQTRATPHTLSGMDYFLFTDFTDFGEIPHFTIGRASWDNWFVFNAIRRNIPVVDLSQMAKAYHQNHDYSHIPQQRGSKYLGVESDENRRLRGEMLGGFGIADADYIFEDGKLKKAEFNRRVETLTRAFRTVQLRKMADKREGE